MNPAYVLIKNNREAVEQHLTLLRLQAANQGVPFIAQSLRTHGRNDKCPCSSGKKFKKCCLRLAESIAELESILRKLPLPQIDNPQVTMTPPEPVEVPAEALDGKK